MNIVLFDNQYRENLLPFTFLRPISEIRMGILTISQKWEVYLEGEVSHFSHDSLTELYPLFLEDDNIFIAGNILPNDTLAKAIQSLNQHEALFSPDNRLMALKAGSPEQFLQLDQFNKITFSENYTEINEKFDIFLQNSSEIKNDFTKIIHSSHSAPVSKSNIMIGDKSLIFMDEGVKMEGCTLNTTDGPIFIGKDVEIMEGSNLRGPIAILEHSVIKMGAKIYGGTTIGPYCKVGGELSNVVMFGYSNKAHDGYLGNAVIGTWCNIGAGTSASNLKNDYGNVRQWNYKTEQFERTNQQFCGLMMGDHSKCGINVSFNTGTVIGICSSVYGSDFQNFYIPSFMIGSPSSGYHKNLFEKIISSEKAMMIRRNIEIDETYLTLIRTLYDKTK